MLRSAAKNHAQVTVIVDPDDYQPVLAELRAGGVTPETRRRLALKVFCATACYDGAIADYLGQGGTFHWGGRKALDMRYGENPHQAAALYGDFLRVAEPLHGKELSYNNVIDIDAALSLAEEVRRRRPRCAGSPAASSCRTSIAPSRIHGRRRWSPGGPPRPRSCAPSPSPGASSSTSSRTRSRSPPRSGRSPSGAGRPRASSRCG